MIKTLCLVIFIGQVGISASPNAETLVGKYRADAIERWEADVVELEKIDQQETYPEDAILFIGSSSIRRWTSMEEDMAPWHTIRRGYGGARLSDLAIFADRLVRPHRCQAIAVFVANDISGSEKDKEPEEVLELYRYVVSEIRKSHPSEPVFFISITPTGSRFQVWERISTVNRLIAEYCDSDPSLHYISTAKRFLTDDGTPDDSLFVEDRLHLNEAGYDLWASIIKSQFERTLVEPKR